MVQALGIPLTGSTLLLEHAERLRTLYDRMEAGDRARLSSQADDLAQELEALVRIRSREELAQILQGMWQRFLRFKADLIQALGRNSEPESVLAEFPAFYATFRDLINDQKEALVRNDSRERLLGALDSAEGLNEEILNRWKSGGSKWQELVSIAQGVGQPAAYADICITAMLLTITGTFATWDSIAVDLLCWSADEYMTDVEDVFLSYSVQESSEEDVRSLQELRDQLDLPS